MEPAQKTSEMGADVDGIEKFATASDHSATVKDAGSLKYEPSSYPPSQTVASSAGVFTTPTFTVERSKNRAPSS